MTNHYVGYNKGTLLNTQQSRSEAWLAFFELYQPPSLNIGSTRDQQSTEDFILSANQLSNDIIRKLGKCIKLSLQSGDPVENPEEDPKPTSSKAFIPLPSAPTKCKWIESEFEETYQQATSRGDRSSHMNVSIAGRSFCIDTNSLSQSPSSLASAILKKSYCLQFRSEPKEQGVEDKTPNKDLPECLTLNDIVELIKPKGTAHLPQLMDVKLKISAQTNTTYRQKILDIIKIPPTENLYDKFIPAYYGSTVWIQNPDILEISTGELSQSYTYDIGGLANIVDQDYNHLVQTAKYAKKLASSGLNVENLSLQIQLKILREFFPSEYQAKTIRRARQMPKVLYDKVGRELYTFPTEYTTLKETIKTELHVTRDYLISLGRRPIRNIKQVLVKNQPISDYEIFYPKHLRSVRLETKASKYTPGYQTHGTLLLLKRQEDRLKSSDISILAEFDPPANVTDNHLIGISQTYPNHTNTNVHLSIGQDPNLFLFNKDTSKIVEVDLQYPTKRYEQFQIPGVVTEPDWWKINEKTNTIWYLIGLDLFTYNYVTNTPPVLYKTLSNPPTFIDLLGDSPVIQVNNILTWGPGHTLDLNTTSILYGLRDAERIDLYCSDNTILRIVNQDNSVYTVHHPKIATSTPIETATYVWLFNDLDQICYILSKADLLEILTIPYNGFTSINGKYLSNPYHKTHVLWIIDQNLDLYEFNTITGTSSKLIVKQDGYPDIPLQYQIFLQSGYTACTNQQNYPKLYSYKQNNFISSEISLAYILHQEYINWLPIGYLDDIFVRGAKVETDSFGSEIQKLASPLTVPLNVHLLSDFTILNTESLSSTYANSQELAISFIDSETGAPTVIHIGLDYLLQNQSTETETYNYKDISIINLNWLIMTEDEARNLLFDVINTLKHSQGEIIEVAITHEDATHAYKILSGDIVKTPDGRFWKVIQTKSKYRVTLTLASVTYPKNTENLGASVVKLLDPTKLATNKKQLKIKPPKDEIFPLPLTISPNDYLLCGYTSASNKPPELLCVKDLDNIQCSEIPKVHKPLSGVGIVSQTQTWIEYTSNNSIDYENSIQITFNQPISGKLAAATYEDLIADPYRNLLIVGYEAIQFLNFTIHPDGKTVTFSNGLLRGRFDTSVWINRHIKNEQAYLINSNLEIMSFTKPINLNSNVIAVKAYSYEPREEPVDEIDYGDEGWNRLVSRLRRQISTQIIESETTNRLPLEEFGLTKTIGTDILKYIGELKVNYVYWESPTTIGISLQPINRECVCYISVSPFIIGEKSAPGYLKQTEIPINTSTWFVDLSTIKIPIGIKYLYIKIAPLSPIHTNQFLYPWYGVLNLTGRKFVSVSKTALYYLLTDRNTGRMLKQNTYYIIQP